MSDSAPKTMIATVEIEFQAETSESARRVLREQLEATLKRFTAEHQPAHYHILNLRLT